MRIDQNELYHYGVKGMKWGVRKEQKKTGQKRKNPVTADTKSEVELGKTHVESMRRTTVKSLLDRIRDAAEDSGKRYQAASSHPSHTELIYDKKSKTMKIYDKRRNALYTPDEYMKRPGRFRDYRQYNTTTAFERAMNSYRNNGSVVVYDRESGTMRILKKGSSVVD